MVRSVVVAEQAPIEQVDLVVAVVASTIMVQISPTNQQEEEGYSGGGGGGATQYISITGSCPHGGGGGSYNIGLNRIPSQATTMVKGL